ncbi:MAG: phosphodiester glycosidase family protein [Candidatus Rifleibacteriota bacterium]
MKKTFVLIFAFLTSTLAWSAENVASSPLSINSKDLKVAFKGEVRHLFGQMAKNLDAVDFGKMPEGIEIISITGCKGLKITQGKMEIRVDSWLDDKGLLERFKECRELYGRNLIAAINGSFYSSRGVLGPLVSDGTLPADLRQIPGSLSRCFVASFRATKSRQYWYIGETSIKGADLLRYSFKDLAWFNVPDIYGSIDNLLGGGGWILREKHDVHRESYERQRFLFRREDQTSRHTVIAQDTDRNLYLLVFEEGQNLHQIARTLAKEPVFAKVRDAFFLDGGSSSSIVLKEKYLVSPLYLVDKARFSAIQVFVLDAQW